MRRYTKSTIHIIIIISSCVIEFSIFFSAKCITFKTYQHAHLAIRDKDDRLRITT